ncbi:MAG: preprotein translocase subunit SecY [Acidimicrobiales bacterium]
MLSSFRNMFRVADLRNKVLFTLLVIAIYQIGTNVPIPGIDFSRIQAITNGQKSNGVIGYLSLFAGSGLSRAAILGLGIMPYITASIIVQLLSGVIPKFEQWRDQGAVGQKKLTQATRYLTVGLAIMQSSGIVFLYHSGRLFQGLSSGQSSDFVPDFTPARVVFMIMILTAGTAFVMWLGELITQRGIGNGMSLIIFSNVISAIPIYGQFIKNDRGWIGVAIVLAVCLLLLTAIVFMEQGQRRIPVTFAKRVQGRRMYGGQSTYIPLKVNQAGVIPIIFASSLLYIPVLLSNVVPWHTYRSWVSNNLLNPTAGVYLIAYGLLIVVFTFFYVHVTFDPHQQADQIRKQGGYIPGFRPGPPTERYLSRILNRLTLPGSLFLALVALIPSVLLRSWHVNNIPFFGTTLLIAVGVALETMKQIDSQLMMRNYEGFLQ